MSDWTATSLSQRVYDLRLLDNRQLDSVWTEFRTRDIEVDVFENRLLEKGLLTNFQLDKVKKGDRDGFLYGKYKVLYIVGAGTFARVYRAVHTESDRVVALKVLRRRFRNEPAQVELFLREARMGLKLKHINIVQIFDVSDDVRAPYMVMEFVEGQTLREFIRVRQKFDVATTLKIMIDIMSGLCYARDQGITHRDMKLSNILITSRGRAKLVDFGLATISEADDKKMATSPNARAIDYVALERGTGVRKNDHRSDIYFAGAVFYHLLTGVAPLTETRDRLLRMSIGRFEEIKPILKLEPELPSYVVNIVSQSLCLQPANRYQEPHEMLAELKHAESRYSGNVDEDAEAIPVITASGKKKAAKIENEGRGRTVMLVESQMEMQNLLREQLKKRGYRVLITGDPGRALDRLEYDENVADCVIFSTQELGIHAVAAFNRLAELDDAASKPAVLLVDKKHKELIDAARPGDRRVLMALPFKIRQLRLVLLKLLTPKQG